MTTSFILNLIRSKLSVITIFTWIIGAVIYAYFYIISILAQPNLEGYESEWQFQLLMFSIFRLPWLLVGLVVVIAIEKKIQNIWDPK
jgi:hypothetical protein